MVECLQSLEAKMICPRCRGRGHRSIRESLGFSFHYRGIQCPDCRGSGHISKEHLRWLRESLVLSELRLSLGYSMREAADEAGVCLTYYNDAEHGRTNPRPFESVLKRAGAT